MLGPLFFLPVLATLYDPTGSGLLRKWVAQHRNATAPLQLVCRSTQLRGKQQSHCDIAAGRTLVFHGLAQFLFKVGWSFSASLNRSFHAIRNTVRTQEGASEHGQSALPAPLLQSAPAESGFVGKASYQGRRCSYRAGRKPFFESFCISA